VTEVLAVIWRSTSLRAEEALVLEEIEYDHTSRSGIETILLNHFFFIPLAAKRSGGNRRSPTSREFLLNPWDHSLEEGSELLVDVITALGALESFQDG
jgi:hypothetical protein